jgi:nicotinamidase-related amidase
MTDNMLLNAKTTALVMIDLQYGIIARALAPYDPEEVLRNSKLLSDTLREKGGTVIFVRVLVAELLDRFVDAPLPRGTGVPASNASELVSDAGIQPTDIVVTKRQWGAFYGTDLEQQLRRHGIRTIVLGGIATNFGVESTAREAFDRGYEIVFAEDAMSSLNREAHNFAVTILFPRMGRVRSTAEIVKAWQ